MQTDTVNLLHECNSGAKTAMNTIQEVVPFVRSTLLRDELRMFVERHGAIIDTSEHILSELYRKGKEPNPMARFMAKTVTEMRLKRDDSDAHIAQMIIEGCQKGIEMLIDTMSRLPNASEQAQELTHQLIELERELIVHMQPYQIAQ